jgi:hypothetical protein
MKKNYNCILKNKMIFVSSLLLSVFLISTSLNAQSHVNFSGKWTLDKNKSNPGEDGSFNKTDSVINISQNARKLIIVGTLTLENADDYVSTEKFRLNRNGSIVEDKDITTKSNAVWSADKKHIIITHTITLNSKINQGEYRKEDTYSLSGDGNILTIRSVAVNPAGRNETTLIYKKIK